VREPLALRLSQQLRVAVTDERGEDLWMQIHDVSSDTI